MLPAAASDQVAALLTPSASATVSAYTSPQAASGEAPAQRGDIFAFGRIAYELLTGDDPFAGHSPSEARVLGLRPTFAPMLNVRQNHAISSTLALNDANRDVTLDAATRAFAGGRRPRSVLSLLAGLRRNPAHAGFVAIPVLAFLLVFAALTARDAASPSTIPMEPTVVVHAAGEGSTAQPLNVAPAVGRPTARSTARCSESPANNLAPAEHIVSSQQIERIEANSSTAAAGPAARKNLDDFARVGIVRAVACANCDCPSLLDKRTFTPEPLRREEQEYMRQYCS